jgi:KUP system potassium uptake protein
VPHVSARFGFRDATDFPQVVGGVAARPLGAGIDTGHVHRFVPKITLRRTGRPGMAGRRKHLFIAMAHNAAGAAKFRQVPAERAVVLVQR